MPILNGYQMALKIKTFIFDNQLNDIPIISYSSNEINDDEILKQ